MGAMVIASSSSKCRLRRELPQVVLNDNDVADYTAPESQVPSALTTAKQKIMQQFQDTLIQTLSTCMPVLLIA
eukprot:1042299-Karenia_brevis.AAC.1